MNTKNVGRAYLDRLVLLQSNTIRWIPTVAKDIKHAKHNCPTSGTFANTHNLRI
jgi:hypothetical protein